MAIKEIPKKSVLVGLSGGVDSSVAALILKEKGYSVIGATMAIWTDDGMARKTAHLGAKKSGACYGPDEKEDIEEARNIAKMLDIPYFVFDCAKRYKKIVLENFKSEYLRGNTPNPCIWCNALVKFGVLPHLAREYGIKFDKFATGHYARIENSGGRWLLKKGVDKNKDQSYFLYRLTQKQLSEAILPLGDFTKDEIRKIAAKYGLKTAQKPDSQDFYSGDYNELLGIKEKSGNIIDIEGKILGQHSGIWNFTVGQRKGLKISAPKPLYVLELREKTNEVVVGEIDKTFKKVLVAQDLNWIIDKERFLADFADANSFRAGAKIRSNGQVSPALVHVFDDKIRVEFEEYQKSIANGQSVVIYDNDTVICGGIISAAE